jgi:hypothetical protein
VEPWSRGTKLIITAGMYRVSSRKVAITVTILLLVGLSELELCTVLYCINNTYINMSFLYALSAVDLEALFYAHSSFATFAAYASPRDAFYALAGESWAIAAPLLVLCGGLLCFAGFRFYESFRKPMVFLALFSAAALMLGLNVLPVRLSAGKGTGAGAGFGSSAEAGAGWALLAVYGEKTISYHTMDLAKILAVSSASAMLSRSAVFLERGSVALISGVCGSALGALLWLFVHICATRTRILFCGLVDTNQSCSSPRNAYDAMHGTLLAFLGGALGMALAIPRALLYYKCLGRALSSIVGALTLICGVLILLFRAGVAFGVVAQMCKAAGGQEGDGLEGGSSSNSRSLEFWSKPHLLAGLSTTLTVAVPVLAFWGFLHQTRAAERHQRAQARRQLETLRGHGTEADEAYNIGTTTAYWRDARTGFGEGRSWRRRSRTPARR